MASEVEPPFVSAAENKGWLHSPPHQTQQRRLMGAPAPRPNSFLLIECNVGYSARLLRTPTLGAPVAMTYSLEFRYINSEPL